MAGETQKTHVVLPYVRAIAGQRRRCFEQSGVDDADAQTVRFNPDLRAQDVLPQSRCDRFRHGGGRDECDPVGALQEPQNSLHAALRRTT